MVKLLVCVAVLLLTSCLRYGFEETKVDGPREQADILWPHDGPRPDTWIHDAPRPELSTPPDDLALLPEQAMPDAPGPLSAPLNLGNDPLNTKASGTLTWSGCAAAFTGDVVVKDLTPGHVYQLKLEQSWSANYTTGKNLGSLCRTWGVWLDPLVASQVNFQIGSCP
jgi:hypothetical protein